LLSSIDCMNSFMAFRSSFGACLSRRYTSDMLYAQSSKQVYFGQVYFEHFGGCRVFNGCQHSYLFVAVFKSVWAFVWACPLA
jgi:hypothetical protein